MFIALRGGADGTGNSADDARDGSTVEGFDTVLRCYAEGCGAPKTANLIVCLGPGTFQTMGAFDVSVGKRHLTPRGFTLGNGWKVHGQGVGVTILQLSAYLPSSDPANLQGLPPGTGSNVVLSTASTNASGVEISDLTIDANYPALKAQADSDGLFALNLEAIHLWSAQGHNWVHNVAVINTAGEIGEIDERFETFAVMINSGTTTNPPSASSGNIIENVVLSDFGGGACTAITLGDSVGEVRNNVVNGYQIGYGGWSLGTSNFHDNVAQDTEYGFNVDSLVNDGVTIAANTITAGKYGMVIGGGLEFRNLTISSNVIQVNNPGWFGILLQGSVTNSIVSGNKIIAGPNAAGSTAILNFINGGQGVANGNNVFQGNQIDSKLNVVFQAPSLRTLNCAFGNHDEKGNPRGDLPDTASVPCVP